MNQLRAQHCNELSFHGGKLVILYKGSSLSYKCTCKADEFYPSHAKWASHWSCTVNLPYEFVCFYCELRQPSVRSMAQHSVRCRVKADSQRNMVTSGDMALTELVGDRVKCFLCENERRYSKKGLPFHIHMMHPQYLYDKYSNKRIKDRRWGPGEAEVLVTVLIEQLKRRNLPLDTNGVHDNLRECYLEVKHKIAKSYKAVVAAWDSGDLKREFEKHASGAACVENTNEANVTSSDESNCECFANILRDTRAQVCDVNHMHGVGKRLRQIIKRELSSQAPHKGTLLLDQVYKHYGEKTDGGRQGLEQPTRQPTSGTRCTNVSDDDLYKSLKSKRYINHLEHPGLQDLQPSSEAIRFFGEQFERPSIEDDEPAEFIKGKVKSTCGLHQIISGAEVELHAKSFDNDTACGTDRFTVVHLKSTPTALLTILMNLFMLASDVPKVLKVNRTTLLAKKPNPGPTEWRPITVSSVLYRLFSKIITRRLAAELYISPYQRAFTNKIDGCLENSSTIGELIRRANSKHESGELYVCSLDLAKAFDSVSFTSIVRMLRRQKVDSRSLKLLTNMLYNNVTIVSKQRESKITRGVRQGDPISPLLFNGVIDELFEHLSNDRYGASFLKRDGGQAKIVAVAFADDITLLCNSQWHLDKLLEISTSFFMRRGMSINIKKSSCLAIRRWPHHDVCTPLPVTLSVLDPVTGSREKLPSIGPVGDLRVLGTYITPLGRPLIKLDELEALLLLIEGSNLSAFYKVELIKNHVAFKYRYRVVYGKGGQTEAGLADKKIRVSVRRILGLPTHTSQQFFHLPLKLGGLGIESLEFASTYLRVKMELKLLKNERESTRELVRVAPLRDNLLRLSRDLGFGLEMTREAFGLTSQSIAAKLNEMDPDVWYAKCRDQWHSKQLEIMQSLIQGTAFRYLSSAPLDFLSKPDKYKLEVAKLPMIYKLRLGFDDLLSNIKGNNDMSKSCRLCLKGLGKRVKETSMHVLQKCPFTKRWRIERHNALVRLLYKELHSKLNGDHAYIRKEQEFVLVSSTGREVRLKPDLVVVCRNTREGSEGATKISIVEVTCSYESLGGNSLESAYDGKRHKYQLLKGYLNTDNNLAMLDLCAGGSCRLLMERQESHPNVKFAVHPFVVGTRGGWHANNADAWKFLSLQPTKLLMNRAYRTSHERSINVVKKFLGRVRAADGQQHGAIEAAMATD